MTISQSRYGGLAEVGRAPENPKRKDTPRYGGILASAGVIGAGGVVHNQNKKYANRASFDLFQAQAKNARRAENVAELKDLLNTKREHTKKYNRYSNWAAGPRSKGIRIDPVSLKDTAIRLPATASAEQMAAAEKTLLSNIYLNQQKMRVIHRQNKMLLGEEQALKLRGKQNLKSAANARLGGKVIGGIGLAGLAGSLFANEKRRGTIGQKTSAPRQITEAEARYRRMNGM